MSHCCFYFLLPVDVLVTDKVDDKPVINSEVLGHALSMASQFMDEEGFCGAGYFASGLSDGYGPDDYWQFDLVPQDELKQFRYYENQLSHNCPVAEERNLRLSDLFQKLFPEYSWVARVWDLDYERHDGAAALITEEIWDKVLKEHRGNFESFYCWMLGSDINFPPKELFGKWIMCSFSYHY